MSANQYQVNLAASAMEVTREPVADNSPELFPKAQISGVYPVKINSKPAAPDDVAWKYPYDNMVIVRIAMADGKNSESHDLELDLNTVTNQVGWTPDLAGQQQCVADILAWL